MKRSVKAAFRVKLTTAPNSLIGGGRPQLIARPIQMTFTRTTLQWTSKIAWTIMRENRLKVLEREIQHRNDRLMENGEREGVVGKSEVPVMKGKGVREERNIAWNAITDASGSLGGIVVLGNQQSRGGNGRIGGNDRTPTIPEVLWRGGQKEANESERVGKGGGVHDSEKVGADGIFYGRK